ncbi:ABC transporter transmembrane domain-containing protein [Tichowtungia aerotolerans]|uniref:ATP-binding cassette domain-containing protein n=1 Tax=Tichowtungia aerotolerans TaxID=2697043 RepID=A0A6P1MCL2_9BACT|nr:ABC transporter transmembrane domain-containing protein [Tichowtungia aerotolerans]QHI70314.1 ATP-binding cassette domain-containing protein [Tichowtungia aerotolerans]
MAAESTNRRFLNLLKPLWLPVSATILCLILLTAVNMVTPMLIGTVFSRVFPERNWSLLWMILGGLTLLFLVRNLLFYHSKCIAVRVGEEVCFNLRTQLFDRIQQKSLIFTRTQNPGKLSSKVMNDSLKIQEFIQGVMPKFIQSALLFAGVMVMIYVLNWQLALASTFVLPLHVLTYRYFGERIKQASRRSRESIDFAAGNIVESLVGVEVVKGFSGEERESQAFKDAIASSRRSQVESLRYVALQKVWADLLVGAGMLALIGFGAWQVIGKPEGQSMLAGDFIAFFWYIRLLYPTVIELMSSGGKLAGAHASVERALELFDEVPQSVDRKAGGLRPSMREDIVFENVSFAFNPEEEGLAVIKGVSFAVRNGDVCAITGPSGAGKTTMVSMLPLLITPDKGTIRIGEHDILSVDLAHLRDSIGVVFQECFLFNTTIMENLRYARPDVRIRRIKEICRQTGADDFIRQLPQGYDSIVGENGITLSRGQKQMITLTRAVIKNPEILILDEATASLDPSLESYVIPTILDLMKGRTTLMITHNPRLLEHADCELILDDGQVASFNQLRRPSARPFGSKAGKTVAAALVAGCIAFGLLPQTARGGEMISRRVRLSYIAPERCVQMLQLYGISIGQAGKPVNAKTLPTVVAQPSTPAHDLLPKMGTGFKPTDSDPIGDLLVFYDEDKPEQFSRVQTVIRRDIDLPARQIMLEAMVMEISEDSIDRLGVEWSRDISSGGDVEFGAGLGDITGQLTVNVDDIFYDFNMKLRALIREGEAEIISRPSVLTLNNRMAFINVSDLVPVAQSKYHGNQAISTVDFKDKEVGIQLAIRPRINEDGKEVSLQVNAVVSAVVAGEDVEVKKDDDVVASSPTISVREVKTYARIANNTPFIIGGLIAKDDTSTRDRVPVLGAIPYLGKLFRFESITEVKREVIIVITPFVLPEADGLRSDQQIVGRNLPQDEDQFDSIGNRLFRDAYRIREEDVYDLDFLVSNEELMRLQTLADQAASGNLTMKETYPYSHFVNGKIPGEQVLVYRQIYSVIRRIGLDKQVDTDHLIFFKKTPDQSTGFDVVFLGKFLQKEAERIWTKNHPDERCPEDIWEALGDHAIALTYTNRKKEADAAEIMFEEVPDVQIVPCTSREEFDRLLWDLNQPDEQGRGRGTILLHTERDLQRVKQAIVLREAIDLNGTGDTMTLANFSTGRLLLLPDRDDNQVDLIGGNIARLFLTTDRYYDLLRESLRTDMDALRNALNLSPKSQAAPAKPAPAPKAEPKPVPKEDAKPAS